MPANDNRRDVVTIKGTGPKTRPAKPSGSRTPPGFRLAGCQRRDLPNPRFRASHLGVGPQRNLNNTHSDSRALAAPGVVARRPHRPTP